MAAEFEICAGLLPIAIYFCWIGAIHLTRRPYLTTGAWNFLAIAFALSGLIITGPIEFLYDSRLVPYAISRHPWSGVVIYAVGAALLAPWSCRTIIVFNVDRDQIATALHNALAKLPTRIEQVGNRYALAELGIVLELDAFDSLRNAVIRFRVRRDPEIFRYLRRELMSELAIAPRRWSAPLLALTAAGVVMLAFSLFLILRDPEGLASGLRDVLNAR